MSPIKLSKTQFEFAGPKRGEAFLPTGGAFLLTVKLLCLQSLKALLRRTSHCKQKSSNCK